MKNPFKGYKPQRRNHKPASDIVGQEETVNLSTQNLDTIARRSGKSVDELWRLRDLLIEQGKVPLVKYKIVSK